LASLIDPSLPAPFVPASVFMGVQSATYWSATSSAQGTTNKFGLNFEDGLVGTSTGLSYVWCVRGPMSESVY